MPLMACHFLLHRLRLMRAVKSFISIQLQGLLPPLYFASFAFSRLKEETRSGNSTLLLSDSAGGYKGVCLQSLRLPRSRTKASADVVIVTSYKNVYRYSLRFPATFKVNKFCPAAHSTKELNIWTV